MNECTEHYKKPQRKLHRINNFVSELTTNNFVYTAKNYSPSFWNLLKERTETVHK